MSEKPKLKTIKVTEEEYDAIKQARDGLLRKGYDNVSDKDAVEQITKGVASATLGAAAGIAAVMFIKELLKK
ncbi:MAG: hypothetical protein ABIC91_07655 [Nanoarchaeota archaeon]